MRNRWRQFTFIMIVLVGLLLSISLPVFAAPFQPGQIFVAYSSSNIGVFADTVSLAGTQVQPLNIDQSRFATSALSLAGGGVALDESGNLYVTVQNLEGTNQSGIIKFKPDGTTIDWKKGSGSALNYRGIVASNALNRVFVATEGGSGQHGIHVYRASDGEKLTGEFFGGTLAFRDLAMDRHGNLYAVRQTAPSAGNRLVVRRWSAGNYQGEGKVVFAMGGDYTNSDPRAIAIDDDGFIYITLNNLTLGNQRGLKAVIKVLPDSTGSDDESGNIGTVRSTYLTPSGTGSLIGLDYDPGTQRLFASHTGTGGIGQILWIDKNAPSGTTMSAFGPTNLSGVRWLAVYPTPEPTNAILLAAGLLLLKRRFRRK